MLATATYVDTSYLRDLSDDELDQLRTYTVACYSDLNISLRNGSPLLQNQSLHNMMQEATRPLADDIIVWRGVLVSHSSSDDHVSRRHPFATQVWIDPAWVSCTLDKKIGKHKAGYTAREEICFDSYLLKIIAPAGTPVVPIYDILKEIKRRSNSQYDPCFMQEQEIVLAAGLQYTTIERNMQKITDGRSRKIITLEVSS